VIAMMNGLGLEQGGARPAETLNEENSALEKLEGKVQELIGAAAESESLDDENEKEQTTRPQLAKASRSRK
jgi:hypothetical protein